MKLCRIRTKDGIRPAAVDEDGALRDLSQHIDDLGDDEISPAGIDALGALDLSELPVIEGSYAPILRDVRRLFCIGLNYHDHAAEMGMSTPEHPVLFMKACPVTGAHDPIILPEGSKQTDWEVELGIVIGATAKSVTTDSAMDHVAGYCVANDVSERDFQMNYGGQWVKGKSCDSFAPLGPWLVTRDAVRDVQNLGISLAVNGVTKQSGHTSKMIFSVPEIVSFVSRFITLQAGDVIITGTPPGVGLGRKPQEFMKPGDMVTAQIDGLGQMRQEVRSAVS